MAGSDDPDLLSFGSPPLVSSEYQEPQTANPAVCATLPVGPETRAESQVEENAVEISKSPNKARMSQKTKHRRGRR